MWPLFCKNRWYQVMIGSAPVAIVTVSSQTTAIRIVCLSNNFPIVAPSPYHDNPMIRWPWQWWGLHWLKNPFVCNLNPRWKLKWLDHWTRSSKQRIAFILEHKCIWWTIDLERWIWSGAVLRVHLHSSDQDNKVQRIGPGNHSFQWRPFQRPLFLFFGCFDIEGWSDQDINVQRSVCFVAKNTFQPPPPEPTVTVLMSRWSLSRCFVAKNISEWLRHFSAPFLWSEFSGLMTIDCCTIST